MLRVIFHEPRRLDTGYMQEANRVIGAYIKKLSAIPAEKMSKQDRRFRIWSESFLRSIDELEQSEYAAVHYGNNVKKTFIDEMTPEELDDYHRHLYYYKNALIRTFSTVDKLGYFMNERLGLQTERMKVRFSYFTVLRNMHQRRLHTKLEEQLFELKQKYKEPISTLRNERNMEIHTINADLLDDLLNAAENRIGSRLRMEAEDVKGNLLNLQQGTEMVFQAVVAVFRYLNQ